MATLNNMEPLGLSEHRSWEDFAAIALGVLIVASPFIAGFEGMTIMLVTTIVAGGLVMAVGLMELAAHRLWEEAVALICGVWMIASPYVFNYMGDLRAWHIGLGVLVALLALLELWQPHARKA
ncbi:SPW repeat protein [Aliihoeflea sp. 2WW]|uniref:SPW repeat domain-containing protein n=1 Tax=Aliihoeflea sp. 2WW TaxID=1381123 RepID=UPI0004B0B079|nr:SPW repeat protein [Aliihoeflea sp. 2WW]